MARTQKTNNLEGGADGVAVTVANSGGASGDAFAAVSNAVGTILEYDNAHAAHGSLSMHVQGGIALAVYAEHQGLDAGASLPDTHAGRCYLYLDAAPSNLMTMVKFYDNAGNVLANIRLDTARKIRVSDKNAVALYTFTTAIPLNQFVRIEWKMKHDTALTGEIEVRLYLTMDASIASYDESSGNLTGRDLGAAVMGRTRYGNDNATTIGTMNMWFDDLLTGAASFVGPAGVGGSGVVTLGALVATSALTAAPTKARPVNTALPVVSGNPWVGQTLTCTTGAWDFNPTSYSYTWLIDGVAAGSGGVVGNTRVNQAGDEGHVISCRVRATNANGFTDAFSNGVTIGSHFVAPTGIEQESGSIAVTWSEPAVEVGITATSAITMSPAAIKRGKVQAPSMVATSNLATSFRVLRPTGAAAITTTSTISAEIRRLRHVSAALVSTSTLAVGVVAKRAVKPGGLVATSALTSSVIAVIFVTHGIEKEAGTIVISTAAPIPPGARVPYAPLVGIPHFDSPLSFGLNGHVEVVEQGQQDDVANCVECIVRTERGTRLYAPDFGIDDPTFENEPLDLATISRQITSSEPRAQLDTAQVAELLTDIVTVKVKSAQ